MQLRFRTLVATACIGTLAANGTLLAFAKDYSDLPLSHFAFSAVQNLEAQGIMEGYSDGTFRPDQTINRAEALKVITNSHLTAAEKKDTSATSFSDVPADAWYNPYLHWAAAHSVILSPVKSPKFRPGSTITKAEFLKMMTLANSIDPNKKNGDIKLPLSSDVSNSSDWFYPFMRFALTSSMTMATNKGLLSPARPLSRGDVAVLMDRFLQYLKGDRVQDLLTEVRTEIEHVQAALEKNDIQVAEYASVRALLAARGAQESKPAEDVVKVAVKISEGFRALVRAFRAGISEDFNTVVKLSGDAWFLAQQAREISPSAKNLADQLQTYASNFAESARKQLKK